VNVENEEILKELKIESQGSGIIISCREGI
jgi:hypothetical protein